MDYLIGFLLGYLWHKFVQLLNNIQKEHEIIDLNEDWDFISYDDLP